MKIFQLIDLIIRIFRLNKRAKAIALFLIPFAGSCQGGFYFSGEPYLLDEYPGASAAYSVHKLRRDYTGNAMQIRRASDNATANIGFIDQNLNTPAISSHCAGTDCFVVTWYDQSGNGNHAAQSTAANQPKIYDASTGLVTENGKPAIQFDGTDDYLLDYFTSTNFYSIFTVSKHDTTATEQQLYLVRGSVLTKGFGVTINPFGNNGTIAASIADATNTRVANVSGSYTQNFILLSVFANYTTENLTGYLNENLLTGSSIARVASNSPSYALTIGINGNDFIGQPMSGNILSLIIYPTDQTANRVGIETSINNYFSIY